MKYRTTYKILYLTSAILIMQNVLLVLFHFTKQEHSFSNIQVAFLLYLLMFLHSGITARHYNVIG